MSQLNNLNQARRNRVKQFDKHIHRKREPLKPSSSKSNVYVNNKSNFKYNLERIERLWIAKEPEIFVRALGAAIPRAINLCLQFQKIHHNVVTFDVSTSTVNLVDDLEPLTEDNDFETIARCNSSICIKLTREIPLKTLPSCCSPCKN